MMNTAMRFINLLVGKKRISLFILSLVCVIGMQCLALSLKILNVEPETYREQAADLKITPEYRYGYSRTWHGAILVKTPNVEGSSPKDFLGELHTDIYPDEPYSDEYPTDNEHIISSSPEDQIHDVPDKTLEMIMRGELTLVPLKFTLELVLYIVMLLYVFFGVRLTMTKLHVNKWRNIGQCLFMVAAWIIFWMIAFFPLQMYGYGYPIHSNWEGPGAFSYTYFPLKISPGSGLTVSYRYVIDILSAYPLMLFSVIAKGLQHLPFIGSKIHLSLTGMGSLFYGLGGIIYILRRNRTTLWKILVRIFLIITFAFLIVILPFPPWRQPQWVRELFHLVLFTGVKILLPWL
jgi:hypothetical protein